MSGSTDLQRQLRDDTRQRFLSAIAERLPVEQVVEMHLFAPLRQGGVESGVAVLAVQMPPMPGTAPEAAPDAAGTDGAADAADADGAADAADADVAPDAHDADVAADGEWGLPEHVPIQRSRLAIYTARYRLVLKGAERGTWDAEVALEADAPLGVVDDVVLGVQQRAGDTAPAERWSGAEFRAMLHPAGARAPCSTTTP